MRLESAIIELHHWCSYRCIFCSSRAVPLDVSSPVLSLDDVGRIVKELADCGVKVLEVSGGEPFLTPSLLFSAILNAVEYGVNVHVFTACSDYYTIIRVLNRIPKKHREMVTIHVSLHSLDSMVTSSIMGINNLNNARRDLDARLYTIAVLSKMFRTCINFTVTRLNYHELTVIVDVVKKLGASGISLLRLVPQGYARENLHILEMGRRDWYRFYNIVTSLVDRYGSYTRLGAPINWLYLIDDKYLKTMPPSACRCATSHIAINPDGTVIPCSAFKDLSDYALGNILNTSLRDILSGDRIEKIVSLRRNLPEKCRKCKYRDICGAKCIAQRLYNDPTSPDPLCIILKKA